MIYKGSLKKYFEFLYKTSCELAMTYFYICENWLKHMWCNLRSLEMLVTLLCKTIFALFWSMNCKKWWIADFAAKFKGYLCTVWCWIGLDWTVCWIGWWGAPWSPWCAAPPAWAWFSLCAPWCAPWSPWWPPWWWPPGPSASIREGSKSISRFCPAISLSVWFLPTHWRTPTHVRPPLYERGRERRRGLTFGGACSLPPVSNIHLCTPLPSTKQIWALPRFPHPSQFYFLFSIIFSPLLSFVAIHFRCLAAAAACPRLLPSSSGGESWRTTPSLPASLFSNLHSNSRLIGSPFVFYPLLHIFIPSKAVGCKQVKFCNASTFDTFLSDANQLGFRLRVHCVGPCVL